MKILFIADTESNYIWDHYNPKPFEEIDLILSAGDLKASYLEFLTTIIRKPLYYVHGNHDTSYLDKPPLGCSNIDDKLITVNGIRILGLGGSMRYKDGTFQYTEREMFKRAYKLRRQLNKSNGFDILLSHSPAAGICDGSDLCHQGFNTFNQLISFYKPSYFLHGHQHLNYSFNSKRVVQYGTTTIINGFNYHIIDYTPNNIDSSTLSKHRIYLPFIHYFKQDYFI